MNTLGNRLKQGRQKLNLTQQGIADLLGLNRVTFQGYEKDKHLPDVYTLAKLADILQTSTDYLLGRYDK